MPEKSALGTVIPTTRPGNVKDGPGGIIEQESVAFLGRHD